MKSIVIWPLDQSTRARGPGRQAVHPYELDECLW